MSFEAACMVYNDVFTLYSAQHRLKPTCGVTLLTMVWKTNLYLKILVRFMTKSTRQMSESAQTNVSDIKDLFADIVDYHNHLKQRQAITFWTSNLWTTGRCSFVDVCTKTLLLH